MKEKYSVLIPDGDSDLLIVVIHCLSQNKGYKLFVVLSEKHKNKEITHSKYINEIFVTEPLNESNEIEWIKNLNTIAEKHHIDIIMPIDVFAIRCLLKNRTYIKDPDKLGLLPPLKSFDKADHKGELSKLLLDIDLPAPETLLFDKNEICEQTPSFGFPVIMKLFEGHIGGGSGIQVFNNSESLNLFFKNNTVVGPYLIQKYIKGYDIDCSVLCKDGDILAFTIQKGTMKGVSDFVPQVGVEFLFEKDVYEVVKKLMKSLNWSGVAHVDMRFDITDKKFKVIEINPRFWGSIDASLIAGVDFTYFYCIASKGIVFEIPKYNHVKYLNLLGLKRTIKQNKWFLFNLKFLLNNTPLKFFIKDPKPFFYILYSKLKKDLQNNH
ncbi:ATP-grasp domain-containing protein [Paucihalobacter ruber]|uniref:ATP-grasp domain-containing protein n=1 Tax=Paucihalobacter ruber TaxID=2567861 RepID=A0A506PL71_9FLAO|nr:ATP-grasp domain-containing protein [Paucihalobacter ruber]TPV34055.1 ATP-grasp domain-containing protein [Paucihalobacter ruber]